MERYYRSSIFSTWNNPNNWSSTPDGTTGATVPGLGDIAIFDASGIGSCALDSTVNILGLKLHEGYTGLFVQNGFQISVGQEGAVFDDGVFEGGSADISISGPTHITSMPFTSTTGTLEFRDDFLWQEFEDPGDAVVIAEEIPLSATDATNKYVTLSSKPLGPVALNVFEGSSQKLDEDYELDFIRIRWGGMALDGLLSEGDVLRVIYAVGLDYGFFHNNGTVELNAHDKRMNTPDIELWNLHYSSDSTNYHTRVDSTVFVENELIMSGGTLKKGVDGDIRLMGDMSCGSTFGSFDLNHDVRITMEGLPAQQIRFEAGGILPDILIDKTSVHPIVAQGTGPIRVNGDFNLLDGTVDTNGLDLLAGPVEVPEMLVGRT